MITLNKLNFCTIIILLLVVFTFAQEETNAPLNEQQPRFYFTADWNCFRAADSLVFLEYTASVARNVLTFKADAEQPGKFSAELLIEAMILQGDSVLQSNIWRTRDVVEQLDEHSQSMSIPIIGSFVITPGDYFLDLRITDLFGASRKQEFKFPVTAAAFNQDFSLSDVQLAISIERDNSKNPFVKNGYKIMPNSSCLYGLSLPILFCYAEVYNLAPSSSEEGNKYSISYRVLDADGKEAKVFPGQTRQKPGSSSVIVNNLNVITLVSGTYSLEIQVRDHETQKTSSAGHKFFVYREGDFAQDGAAFAQADQAVGQGSPGLDASRYDSMKEDELDVEFDMARYIAEQEEAKTWKKLNHAGKKEYIKEFWAHRDKTLGTPANEYKDEYLGRAQMANSAYRGHFRDGYKTDRGRILLVYGKPDEIERFPASSDAKEYQVWHYYSIQGGVDFIFADKRNMSDLELVHSTARGELYDPDWMRWILPDY